MDKDFDVDTLLAADVFPEKEAAEAVVETVEAELILDDEAAKAEKKKEERKQKRAEMKKQLENAAKDKAANTAKTLAIIAAICGAVSLLLPVITSFLLSFSFVVTLLGALFSVVIIGLPFLIIGFICSFFNARSV